MFLKLAQKARQAIEGFLYLPAYAVLFSAYSVLALYANNVHGIPPADLVRPLGLAILVPLLLFWGAQGILRRPLTSALLVLVILFFFFNYGHARNLLHAAGVTLKTAVFASVWLGLALGAWFWILSASHKWDNATLTPTLNLIAIILLLFPLVRLTIYRIAKDAPLARNTDETISLQATATSPDIYYIILDGYTRSDVLKANYGYDNSAFIDELQGMGFYVAECAQSNYGFTSLSLASTLNLDYIQNINDSFQPGETDLLPAFKLMDSNLVRNSLTQAGYKTVVFASGFTWVEWNDADHFLAPPPQPVSEFELMILLSTYARLLDDFDIVNLDELHAEHYRSRTRFVLGSADDILAIPSPKFVFIHIIAPHEPFAFDKNGSPIAPDKIDNINGYAQQSEFISNAILPYLEQLITGSSTPPIIILQGDHGRLGDKPEDLLRILNAYYVPESARAALHPSITPVNTFRVVFNSQFGTNYPLLEDTSYFSRLSSKYDFTEMPNECKK